MENCKVWCKGLKKIYEECCILEKKTGEHNIFRRAIDYILCQSDANDTSVGIYLKNGIVTFTCDYSYFKTGNENVLNSFKEHACRKYRFYTLEFFFKKIHELESENYTIELSYSEIMDYLFNDEKIDGYFLFVNHSKKYVYISKKLKVFENCDMME